MWASIKARLFGKVPAEDTASGGAGSGRSSSSEKSSAAADATPFTEGFLGKKIGETTLDDALDDLEIVLLQSDVALPVVERIRRDLRRELADKKLKIGTDAEEAIRASFERSVRSILTKPTLDLPHRIRTHTTKPYTVLFVGVNGTGKTTTVAKLAHWLGGQKFGVVIAAGDTFRAGAIEQLLVHGERIGIKVVRQSEGSDPAAVAFDAVQHAKAKSLDVVLIDTAGRQHTNINLIEEAKKIRRVVHPDLTIFVGDALTGNDVVEQARLFQKELGVDGLILNKLDADVKGGAALSATFVTGKPILFVGTGQGYDDFRRFEPEWMVSRLFAEAAS
ncbi:MAG TPA: signal recognition particle-docking protein FtsY [Thermoplasmata archaeon]|nr:signal recognition particle-docking protein FtsY [Thermoplasmata archaeon]